MAWYSMRQMRPWPTERPQPKPPPPPPPTRLQRLRQRIANFYSRYHSVFLILAGALLAFSMMLAYDSTKPPPQRLTQRDINAAVFRAMATATPRPSFASIAYANIIPSVVRVRAMVATTSGKQEGSLGTGVVIDESGLILTALHVVRGAMEIQITFYDGSESEAVIVAQAPENDLAVLRPRIIPDDLQPAVLAGSGGLRVGDEVFAVGNPFGVTNSLTAGVVSGLNRSFKSPKTGATMTGLIQFDAAVNPGNSGGPLVNRNGEVVGIVSSLLNPTDQDVFIGIGFAVTIETAAAAAGGTPPY
jgi:S1-C subfamily serine protease